MTLVKPLGQFLPHSKHYTCELKIDQNSPWVGIDQCWNIKVNYTKVDSMWLAKANLRRLCSFSPWRRDTHLNVHVHICIHTYIYRSWKRRLRWEHQNCASQTICGEVYFYFCSQVNRYLVLLCMTLLCPHCSTWVSPQAFDRLRWIYSLFTYMNPLPTSGSQTVHTTISISNLSVPSSLCTSKEPFTNWPQYADDTGLYRLRVSPGVLSVTQEHFIG